MKRKLALLLSVVMILLAIPVSAQSSDNRLTRSSMNIANYTLLFESGLHGGSGRVTGNAGTLEAWADGSDLVIEVRHTIPSGLSGNGMFRVSLENARFFFRNTTATTSTALNGAGNPGQFSDLSAMAAEFPDLIDHTGGNYVARHGQDTRQFSGTFEGAAANPTTTYVHDRGVYANNRYLRFADEFDVRGTTHREVPYVMEISMADETSATIILLEEAHPGDRIIIPMVSRTTATSEDVHVAIEGGSTSVQSGRFLLATTRGGRTSTRALGVRASRTDFDLREIVISELRMGSIRNGAGFELVAPPGFYFGNLNNIEVHVEPGLSWTGGRTGTGTPGGTGGGGGGGGPVTGATAAGTRAGFNATTGVIADVRNAFETNVASAGGFLIEAVGSQWVAWVTMSEAASPIRLDELDWYGTSSMPSGRVTIHARAFATNPITTSGGSTTVTGTAIASEELGTIANFNTVTGGTGGGGGATAPSGTPTTAGTAAGFVPATGMIADLAEAFTPDVSTATGFLLEARGSSWAVLRTAVQAGAAIDLADLTWVGPDDMPSGNVTIYASAYTAAPTLDNDGPGGSATITGGTFITGAEDVALGTINDFDLLTDKGGRSVQYPTQHNANNANQGINRSSFVAFSSGGDYTVEYRVRAGREDRGTLQFNMHNLQESTRMPGRIIITGATLIAEDPDRMPIQDREISLTIRNMPSGTSYTEESFIVGRMSDYIVNLTRRGDTIPELISGRLDSYIVRSGSQSDTAHGILDETHRAADVRVEEAITNAWWAERSTEFRLPEGVKVLRARFLNLTHLNSDSVTTLTNNPRSVNPADFFNTGVRENNSVLIRDNVITISRLGVTTQNTNNRARFDLRLWLNIDVDFEGDIDLSLTGSSMIPESANQSVTIARAIRPVEVHTRVSDVRVGYQFVSVADFDIVENVAGALRHGETAYISVTDEISVDMHIAPGFRTQVTDGNIRISNVMLRSALGSTGEVIEGQLRFDIERESSEASTISFTGVQVKVANTVPFSNVGLHSQRGINLIVWGPAVAANFEGLISGIRSGLTTGETLQTRDFFPTPGIRANYINVITPAPGGINEFINEVRASIGNPVILVNGQQYTMPVAPYVSPVSNSTMVPVRFISLALGLPESAVRWDPMNSTVTVDAGNRIVQFQTGSYHYTVNGTAIPMLSPDGLPVSLEIREERAFVPFRALGEAFGIRVTWEQDSTTAIFNERR